MKKLDTPCFIFDEIKFQNNLQNFFRELKYVFPNAIIGYSFKTNSLPYIITTAKANGCYAEVVSDVEYQLALRLGFKPTQIIFNGPAKGKEQFSNAFQNKSIINIDSTCELLWLEELAKSGASGSVGIRVNIDLEASLPGHTVMGVSGGRFGFNEENGSLHKAISFLNKLDGITINGLHMHVSSKTKSVEVYQELAKRACEIALNENINLKYIDIGGGFFGGGDNGKAYHNYVTAIYEELKKYDFTGITVIVEPGASVVATTVDYMTKVLDTKETNRNFFVITDGSRLHIDPFFRKEHHEYSLITDSAKPPAEIPRQIICGYTCMENDRLMELNDQRMLCPEDKIIYHIEGAYTMCFNAMFIEYLPVVYVRKGEQYFVIREKWSVDEYLQKNKWEVQYEKCVDFKCRDAR